MDDSLLNTVPPSQDANAAEWKAHADRVNRKFRAVADSENKYWTGTQFKGSQYDDDLNNVLPNKLQNARATATQKARKEAPSYKHGGTVKKTGLAMVHEGETVIPKGKKGVSHNRKFLSDSSAKYQKRQMYGRGPTERKHGREVKSNGIK